MEINMPTQDFNLADNHTDSQPHQYYTLSNNNNRQHYQKREEIASQPHF